MSTAIQVLPPPLPVNCEWYMPSREGCCVPGAPRPWFGGARCLLVAPRDPRVAGCTAQVDRKPRNTFPSVPPPLS